MSLAPLVTRLGSPAFIVRGGLSAPAPTAFSLAGSSFLHTLVEWELASGTLRFDMAGTSTPTRAYKSRVLSISPISSEIPVECGLYSVGNLTIVYDNSDGYFSALKEANAWRNTTKTILMGYPHEGFHHFSSAFKGIVTDFNFQDETVTVTVTDDSIARLKIPITDVLQRITPGGYPDASPEDAKPELIPYVAGSHEKPVGTTRDVGQLPARRINNNTSPAYVVGHGSLSVSEVYVYGVLNTGYSTDTFVAPGGELFTRITFVSDPRDLANHSADELEVTWNGYNLDAEFHPIWQMFNFLTQRCGFSEDEFDLDTDPNAHLAGDVGAMSNRNITGAWAIVDANQTVEDEVAEFCNSHGIRLFRRPDGIYSFHFLGTTQDPVADFTESHEILDGTFHVDINPAESTASRLQINWDWNYVRQFYARQPDLNSPSQETALRFPKRRNKSLRFVRTINGDASGAYAIGALYAGLMEENVQFPSFEVPASFFATVGLGDVVTVTHAKGIGASGYQSQRMTVLSKSINPAPEVSRMSIRGVVSREPDTGTTELSATFMLEGGLEVILEAT